MDPYIGRLDVLEGKHKQDDVNGDHSKNGLTAVI